MKCSKRTLHRLRRTDIDSLFTANEILDEILELGYEAILSTESDGDFGDFTSITITTDEENIWLIPLGYEGPYYKDISIEAYLFTEENPHLVADRWNQSDRISVATVLSDPDTKLPIMNEGLFVIKQRIAPVYFSGNPKEMTQQLFTVWEDEYDGFVRQMLNIEGKSKPDDDDGVFA